MDTTKRALVVGLGISGMATAIRLHRAGWQPVIIEKAPARRTTGYFVFVYGAGRAAAERLGILPDIPDRVADTSAFYAIDRLGNRRRTPSFGDVPNRPDRMLRTDVEDALFRALPPDIEIRYNTVPTHISQDADGVDVTIGDTVEQFDLVVGADGVHSSVRRLVFGPDEQFLFRMHHIIAAFELSKPLPGLDVEDSAAMVESGRALWVFGFEGRLPTVMMTYGTDDVDAEFREPPAQRLRKRFGTKPAGKLLGQVLDEAESGGPFLFDQTEQIRMSTWHKGRVVLVGDSAWCVTLYAGMGVSAGLAGADLLGTMLERADIGTALTAWERKMRPTIDYYQQRGLVMRSWFNPTGRKELVLRSVLTEGAHFPVLGPIIKRLRGKDIAMKNRDVATT